MLTVDPRPERARGIYWGASPAPQGAIIVGTVARDGTDKGALVWLPYGWTQGNAATLRGIDPTKAQSAWLKALRGAHDWDKLCKVADCSRRTWEGWEQGRAMPALAVYKLATQSAP